MKTTKLSRVLAVFLTVTMLAGSFGAFTVNAADTVKTPTSKIDILFTEDGYGFENFTGDVAASETSSSLRDNVYYASGLYFQSFKYAAIASFTKDADGKLTAGGDDQKLYLNLGQNTKFCDPRAVSEGTNGLGEARYINDLLCSDAGYSKYTLEMDVAITGNFTGTNDGNDGKRDFSPYRGFSLLYLFSSGYTIKATGLGVGTGITYDSSKTYVETGTTDAYVEGTGDIEFYDVTAVDMTNAAADVGYLYMPATSSNYIMSTITDSNKALGTKSTAQENGTYDITGAIDFNKIAAKDLTPAPYKKDVEKTLKIDFEVTANTGANNDVYTATIYYGGVKLGTTSYTANNTARKEGIKFVDCKNTGVTLDNIRLSVDTSSAFRYCDGTASYGDGWFDSYWRDAVKEHIVFSDISNTYNNFSAILTCNECGEWDYATVDAIIENNIVDLIGGKSHTITDLHHIVDRDDEYWVVTDVHIPTDYTAPTAVSTLINAGGTDVLKLGTDGAFTLADGTATTVKPTAKNSYTVAIRAIPSIGKYQLYVDSVLVGTAALTTTTNKITLASLANVNLLNIKAVTLTADNPTGHSGIYSLKDASATYCAHKEATGGDRVFHKFPISAVPVTNNVGTTSYASLVPTELAYSFICTECGQRAYTETGDNLIKRFTHTDPVADVRTDYSMTRTVATGYDDFFSIFTEDFALREGADTFWLSFDFTPISLSNVATGGNNSLLNFMKNYSSLLRYYNVDGKYHIGCAAQGGAKITDLTAGETYKFAIRVDPHSSTGTADMYINGSYIGQYKGNIAATITSDYPNGNQIRVGLRGKGTYANFAIVKEAHTCDVLPTEIAQTDDTISYSSTCCGKTGDVNINSVLTDNIKNVSDGFETLTVPSASEYWFATDINVRNTVADGALITLGADKLLEISGGKLVSGTWTGKTVSAPTTYSVAAKISGTNYDLFIDGKLTASGTLTAADQTALTLGCETFGYDVRFNYNKLVTLGTAAAVAPNFTEDKIGTVCYHNDTSKSYEDFSTKLVSIDGKNVNLLYTTYICGGCGERVYDAEQGENLYTYISGDKAISMTDGKFKLSGQGNLFHDKTFMNSTSSDYWMNFSFKITAINTEKPRTNSSNASNKGEANFLNIMGDYESLLRVYTVPNTVTIDTPISYFKNSGTHFKITDEATCSDEFLLLRSRRTGQNIGLLYEGAEYDVSFRVSGGKANVYINDVLVVTNAAFVGSGGYYRFFDQPSGTYEFSNFAFVENADSYVDFEGMGVVEADVTHTADAAAETYTDVFSIDGDSLLSISDASGELVVPSAEGYTSLFDHEGNKIVVGTDATKLGLVNNGGKFNYYVNGVLARTSTLGEATVYAQDLEPVTKLGMRELELGNGVALTGNYGIGGTGTAEYIGDQKRNENEVFQNQIRIVAGLNSLYHGNVGFKVTNNTTGKEISKLTADTNVYSSLLADSEKVYATDYGYNYFSIFEITDISTKDSTNEISVIPYTTVGNKVTYGKEKIITIKVTGGVLTIE